MAKIIPKTDALRVKIINSQKCLGGVRKGSTMMLSGGYTTPHNLAQILGHRDSQMVHQVYAKFINDGKFDFKLDINPY
jgi:hypothetical protein